MTIRIRYLKFASQHIISDGQGFARTFALLLTNKSTSNRPENVHKAGRQFHGRSLALSWLWQIVMFLYLIFVMLYNSINILFHTRRSLRAPTKAVRHQVYQGLVAL